jgi:RNA recognition motif-containing protein
MILFIVGNLSWTTTELALGRHFEQYGDIKSVKIIEDFNGRSKGFGYVEFESKNTVAAALKADGSELDGRTIRVNVIKRKEEKNN